MGSVSRPEISGAAQQPADEPWRAARAQLELDIRVEPAELLEQHGKDVETYGHPADQAKGPGEGPAAFQDAGARLVDVAQDAASEAQQGLAGGRDANPPPDPQKQRFVQLFFEQQDLSADGRLRDVQASPRAGERTGLNDRAQDFQLTQVHLQRASAGLKRGARLSPHFVFGERDVHERLLLEERRDVLQGDAQLA